MHTLFKNCILDSKRADECQKSRHQYLIIANRLDIDTGDIARGFSSSISDIFTPVLLTAACRDVPCTQVACGNFRVDSWLVG